MVLHAHLHVALFPHKLTPIPYSSIGASILLDLFGRLREVEGVLESEKESIFSLIRFFSISSFVALATSRKA